MNVDVSGITAAPGPNLDGDVIPPDTQEESAEFVGVEAELAELVQVIGQTGHNRSFEGIENF